VRPAVRRWPNSQPETLRRLLPAGTAHERALRRPLLPARRTLPDVRRWAGRDRRSVTAAALMMRQQHHQGRANDGGNGQDREDRAAGATGRAGVRH
jgi:hypothetical protein